MTNKSETRSPIRDAPLRHAGDSTLSQIFDHAVPSLKPVFMFAMLCGLVSGVFLGHLIHPFYPYAHFALILLPAGAYIYAHRGIKEMMRTGEPYRLGLTGERAVAERLDELKSRGYRVFHDIPSMRERGANIDHLVVGHGGIFVIETKARSKPVDGTVEMFFDGVSLTRDDGVDESDAIGQVRAVADELREWLLAELDWDASATIRPIVTFPGWYINRSRSIKDKRVWALNDKAMIDWITREDARMSDEIAARVCNRIAERVRRHQRESTNSDR